MPRYVVEGACSGSTSAFVETSQSFCHKPAKGWQNSDQVLLKEGIAFNVKYIGCIEIKTSMKMLDFTMRSQVAKECISRVCEVANLMSTKPRHLEKRIEQCISTVPQMDNAGADVELIVCSKYLSLQNLQTDKCIGTYDMPRISFASGGDTSTMDYVSFVAKDLHDCRNCYVIECGSGQAQNLISTIGQAFELRYNEYFNKTQPIQENLNNAKEYYNDLPDKLPPDMLNLPVEVLSATKSNDNTHRDRPSSNLIDLNSPLPKKSQSDSNGNTSNDFQPLFVTRITRDVFDMQPFSLTGEVQRSQLQTERWFHSIISRPVSEGLLVNDGDFLVRESKGQPGQYVLTGLQGTTAKHLLLIDPEGVVRTKDRIFDSISHLINYHWANLMPILSEDSALVLRNPVVCSAGK